MSKSLHVSVLKDGAPFVAGDFDVDDADYATVAELLKEVAMERGQAASLLGGYMHAKDVGEVTEDMGKIALIAAVYMLEQGETSIEIPLAG